MGSLNQFKVRLSGLNPGKHNFEFEADNSFFEKLEYSQHQKGEVQIALVLDKKSTHLELSFQLNGWIGEECDRCTIDYHQPISGEYKMYVKFGDGFDEPSDDLLVIPRDEHELDVSHMIYEFIELSAPFRKVPCDESGDTSICDKKVLERLKPASSESEKGNSMWAALKDIKDQLKE